MFFNNHVNSFLRKAVLAFTLPVVSALQFSCGSTSSEEYTVVHRAYFVDSSTIGIIISKYKGGDGVWIFGNEHPFDYYQKVLYYQTKTGSITEKNVVSYRYPYTPTFAISDSIIVETYDLNSGFSDKLSCYSLDGTLLVEIPVPAGIDPNNPYIAAISPDSRYVVVSEHIITTTGSYTAFRYDRKTGTFGNAVSLPADLTLLSIENDGEHFVGCTPTYETPFYLKRIAGGQTSTLFSFSQTLLPIGRNNRFLFKDTNGKSGYFSIDTLASKATFVTPELSGSVEDIDTVTGAYLSIINGSVCLGNYKSKTGSMSIYP